MNIYKQFAILSQGHKVPKIKSQTHGTLLIDGLPVEQNKPFAILQALKRIKYGHINKTRIKIIAMTE